MKYVLGKKEDFFEFVENIRPWEKIAILTHNDLDGIASALFLEKILNAKGLNVFTINFLQYRTDFFSHQTPDLRKAGVTKVFVTDFAADSLLEDFTSFRSAFDTFLLDHHPINPLLSDIRKMIKTESADCTTHCIYLLGEGIFDLEEWAWLDCATLFSEYSYQSEENFDFMKKYYPMLDKETISSSVPGMNARKIGNALTYYRNDLRKVYDLVKEKKISEIEDVHRIVEDEIDFHVENLMSTAKYYPQKNLYLYEFKSAYPLSSPVSTIASKFKPEAIFLVYSVEEGHIKVSARCNSGAYDVGKLMQAGVKGLEGANGGGHKMAAAARFNAEDFEMFIDNVLNA